MSTPTTAPGICIARCERTGTYVRIDHVWDGEDDSVDATFADGSEGVISSAGLQIVWAEPLPDPPPAREQTLADLHRKAVP